jgi:hypothetical protein
VPGKPECTKKRSSSKIAAKDKLHATQTKEENLIYQSTKDVSEDTESRRMFPRLISSGVYNPKIAQLQNKKTVNGGNALVSKKMKAEQNEKEDDIAYPPLTMQNLKTVAEVIVPSSSPPSNASTRTGSTIYKGKRHRHRNRKRKHLDLHDFVSEESNCRLFHAIEISGFQLDELNGIYNKKNKAMCGRATYWKENGGLVLWWNSEISCWLISSPETMKGNSDVVLASIKDLALDPQFTKGSWRLFQTGSKT